MAEMAAIYFATQFLLNNIDILPTKDILLATDNDYVYNVLMHNNQPNSQHTAFFSLINSVLNQLKFQANVTLVTIPGHSDFIPHEYADLLAKHGADELPWTYAIPPTTQIPSNYHGIYKNTFFPPFHTGLRPGRLAAIPL